MARKRSKNADILSKVRKRYQRAANRFRNDAKNLDGVSRNLLDSIALRIENQAQSFTLKNLRNRYSADEIDNVVKNIEDDSVFALQSTDVETRQIKLGKVLLSDPDVAARFYSGTIELWRGKKGSARDQAILDYFDVDSIYEAIEKLSDLTGEDLAQLGKDEAELYQDIKDSIRESISSRLALG